MLYFGFLLPDKQSLYNFGIHIEAEIGITPCYCNRVQSKGSPKYNILPIALDWGLGEGDEVP